MTIEPYLLLHFVYVILTRFRIVEFFNLMECIWDFPVEFVVEYEDLGRTSCES